MADPHSLQAAERPNPIPPTKLWFGFTGTAAAWVALSFAYVLITWWACWENQPLGNGTRRSGIAIVYFVAALLFIGIAVFAGLTSYRNWRSLSSAPALTQAQATGRSEFLALLGVFVSFTLGIGLIWLTIPLLIIELCVRTR